MLAARAEIVFSAHVVHAPEVPASAKPALAVAEFLGQLIRALVRRLSFSRGRAERIGESGTKAAKQLELEALSIGRGRHSPQQSDRPRERVRRLAHRRPTEGRATGPRPCIRGGRVEPGFGQVICEQFWLGFDDSRKPLLEHVRDASVQLLAPGLEQRLIGGVLDQRVLETVDRLGRAAAAKHELGGDQLVEPAFQLLLRPVGDCGEQLVGELAADHGADLGELLDRGQPVEPRHQQNRAGSPGSQAGAAAPQGRSDRLPRS